VIEELRGTSDRVSHQLFCLQCTSRSSGGSALEGRVKPEGVGANMVSTKGRARFLAILLVVGTAFLAPALNGIRLASLKCKAHLRG
jgi:hypothetical protein